MKRYLKIALDGAAKGVAVQYLATLAASICLHLGYFMPYPAFLPEAVGGELQAVIWMAALSALLVIDATTGQNGLAQAKVFSEVANLDGIVLTKLDGTAKGGIAIAIRNELGLPVRYIGLGEQLDDMQPFDAKEFVDAIFG